MSYKVKVIPDYSDEYRARWLGRVYEGNSLVWETSEETKAKAKKRAEYYRDYLTNKLYKYNPATRNPANRKIVRVPKGLTIKKQKDGTYRVYDSTGFLASFAYRSQAVEYVNEYKRSRKNPSNRKIVRVPRGSRITSILVPSNIRVKVI